MRNRKQSRIRKAELPTHPDAARRRGSHAPVYVFRLILVAFLLLFFIFPSSFFDSSSFFCIPFDLVRAFIRCLLLPSLVLWPGLSPMLSVLHRPNFNIAPHLSSFCPLADTMYHIHEQVRLRFDPDMPLHASPVCISMYRHAVAPVPPSLDRTRKTPSDCR